MSDFDLPPKRTLPFEVRMSMRGKLNDGMNSPRRPRVSFGALFATMTLVAGTAVGGPLLFGAADEGPLPGGEPNFNEKDHERIVASMVKHKDADLDRCRQAGGDRFGDRSRWRAVFRTSQNGGDVTAIRTDGRPLFCHTTRTQVHLLHSDVPDATNDHAVQLHAVSRFGFLAGSTSRDSVTVTVTAEEYLVRDGVPKTSYHREGTTVVDGLFVLPTLTSPGALSLTSNGMRRHRVTKLGHRRPALTPVLTVTDRPIRANRDSALGQELSACVAAAANTGRPAPDPESWEPALALDLGKHGRTLVARSGEQIGVCRTAGAAPGFWSIPPRDLDEQRPAPSADRPVVPGYLGTPELEISTRAGRVLPEVTKLTLIDKRSGERLPTVLGNGIFVVQPLDPRTVTGGRGSSTLSGPLQAEITERTPKGGESTRTVVVTYL
ncbi:hypothetical protein NLX83_18305 [Allokutzneria sp. A3M-2-11 16]|uniref:hypothetical protein n=1 Tax=Allokutzneria sp. A3M-2-11 16 TaxID=2962043 RepID=UPI0020B8FD26|nr:hypothetical protein [Allokutzneria sp. A3M-2-11 16]MCP3801216.1 hypothetical protein [Allokutzneria sp. A3M-2-11 16]